MPEKQKGGLSGISAGQTAICTVGREGKNLHYRGYSIKDLVDNACFEEVAHLLIHGHLPNADALQAYQEKLQSKRNLPGALKIMLEQIPEDAHPMDVLKIGCDALGTMEQENEQRSAQEIADRLLACFPSILLYWYHSKKSGINIDTETDDKTIAAHFLHLLHQKEPDELQTKVVDVSLILYAEHEFNASTFASRVTAATLSDFYSAITSAIGTLRGSLHGGANEAAMQLIERFATPDAAQAGIEAMLAKKELIMGFGHAVYKLSDPRTDIIKSWAKRLAYAVEDTILYPVAERIEQVMKQEKNLFPNLDFYSAPAYHYCGIPTPMFTPIFVMARLAGWSAHIIEQRSNNRLIRPTAEYIGPEPTEYLPISERN